MCDRTGCSKEPVIVTISDGKAICTDHAIAVFAPEPREKGAGASATLRSSHGGFAGKSLIEKLIEDLDEAYSTSEKTMKRFGLDDETARLEGLAEGIAHALGVLRGSSCDEEWKLAEERYGSQ